MGTILHVEPVGSSLPYPIVLKYCKALDAKTKARFSREVRYLAGFEENSRVLQVIDSNLTMDPPYFVMKYYSDGDLSGLAKRIQDDITFQEIIFNKMLDCISELHARGFQHRDIKPQNFLVEGESIVVSDLGLAKEIGAGTTFTQSHEFWGTHGYIPPEFLNGGFKASSPPSDIFMLGKTFYFLLTGRGPLYLTGLDIPPAIYHVIERCCEVDLANRYAAIADLKQDLRLAYDVILGRAKGIGEARQSLSQIVNRLNSEKKYDADEVTAFLDLLAKLPADESVSVIYELPKSLYYVLAQDPIKSRLCKFLDQYSNFSQSAVATWSYAEMVADHMKIVFERSTSTAHRARALEIAIDGALTANRFAAMDTCSDMITSVSEPDLGVAVAAVIGKYRGTFVGGIEPFRCHDDAVRNALIASRSTT